jgi:3-oxoacyl-[acyl-carrier-protein] synthase-3
LLAGDEGLETALLVAADVTIPGNRVLHPRRPVSVLGDGASALVLRRGDVGDTVVATRIETVGALHDVCCIRGGAMLHPERTDLYRLELDEERYAASGRVERLCGLVERLLSEVGLDLGQVRGVAYTNISAEDRAQFLGALGATANGASPHRGARHGHLQGTDLVLNYLGALDDGHLAAGDHLLVASHGMGFMYGATLIRRRNAAGAMAEAAS